jgi:hypothetical protein
MFETSVYRILRSKGERTRVLKAFEKALKRLFEFKSDKVTYC